MNGTAFYVLALLCVIWGVVSSMAITAYLSNRGVKINWLLIRVMIIRYVSQYHTFTKKERGRPGPWYYSYIVSMNLALLFVIIGIVVDRI